MGIPKGWGLVEGTQQTVNVRTIGGQVVIEDGMIMLTMAAIREHDTFLKANYAPAVEQCMEAVMWWITKGVRPIFGLDGERVPAKQHAHSLRDARVARARELLTDSTLSQSDKEKALKQVVRVNTPYIVAMINACRSAGIAVYRGPFEFDAMGAFMNRLGAAWAVSSKDNDLLWYGAERVIRDVDRATGELTLYSATNIFAAGDHRWGKQVDFFKLVRVLGVVGAGVTAGMIASDYYKAEGWTPTYAVKLLATPAVLKKVKTRRQGRAPNLEEPWGAPLQAADLCAILNGAKDTAHPTLTAAGGMQTARDAYVHQVVSNPAKVGADLHVIEQPLSQALACLAVQVDTVAELPAPIPATPACGTARAHTARVTLPGAPTIEVPAANAYSQGWCATDGSLNDLVVVQKMFQLGQTAPTHLVPSMTTGGMLHPARVSVEAEKLGSWATGSISKTELQLFMFSRYVPACLKGCRV